METTQKLNASIPVISQYTEIITNRFQQTAGFFTELREFIGDLDLYRERRLGKYLDQNPATDLKAVVKKFYFTITHHVEVRYCVYEKGLALIVEAEGWQDALKQRTVCVLLVFDVWGKCLAATDIIIQDRKASGYVNARDNGTIDFFKNRINDYISLQINNRQVEIVDSPYIYCTATYKKTIRIKNNLSLKKLKSEYPKQYAALHSIVTFFERVSNANPIVWYGLINKDFYLISKLEVYGSLISYTLYEGDNIVMSSEVEEDGEILIISGIENRNRFYLTELFFEQIKKQAKKNGFKRIEISLHFDEAALIHKFKYTFSRRPSPNSTVLYYGIPL